MTKDSIRVIRTTTAKGQYRPVTLAAFDNYCFSLGTFNKGKPCLNFSLTAYNDKNEGLEVVIDAETIELLHASLIKHKQSKEA